MTQNRKRGPALTIFLIYMSVVALFGVAIYVYAWNLMLATYPAWSVYTLVGIFVLRIVSVVLMWLWSKSGVVLYVVLTVVAVPLCLYIGYKWSPLGLVGVLILLLLVRTKWSQMQWGFESRSHTGPTVDN